MEEKSTVSRYDGIPKLTVVEKLLLERYNTPCSGG